MEYEPDSASSTLDTQQWLLDGGHAGSAFVRGDTKSIAVANVTYVAQHRLASAHLANVLCVALSKKTTRAEVHEAKAVHVRWSSGTTFNAVTVCALGELADVFLDLVAAADVTIAALVVRDCEIVVPLVAPASTDQLTLLAVALAQSAHLRGLEVEVVLEVQNGAGLRLDLGEGYHRGS